MSDKTTRIILEIPDDLLAEVAEHRFVHRLPSRTEAFRQLIRAGLKTSRAEKPHA
jgi:metal-responsive CopG/Arc/MetJ family transcriptional regulator